MNIAIIKYNAGNTRSVSFALERLGISPIITDDADLLRSADKVIFPGVGEAGTAMRFLRERGLDETIKNLQQPVLGICLGMQLLCNHSAESDTECLGIFNTNVERFTGSLKVPHVGWNKVDNNYLYFLHGYYAGLCEQTTLTCEYGIRFSAALENKNFYGVQFHPEKSGDAGESILKNFLSL